MQTYFRVSLDNHNMTVIQTDFVPILPYHTDNIAIAIGQRYSVIIEADQANATYWLRTWPQTSCSGPNANDGNGIASAYVRYASAPDIPPTSTSIINPDNCDDEFDEVVPYLRIDIDGSGFNSNQTDMGVSQTDYTFPGTNDTVNRCAFSSSWI